MNNSEELKIKLYSDSLVYYPAILNDIKIAVKYIYIEMYRFRNDPIGVRFSDLLVKKREEGVEVRVLVDSWGASSSYYFFKPLIDLGAEVKFFKKIKISWDGFTKSHRRDHRKIIVIDDILTYIGSANINDYSLSWRESVFRIKGDIARCFKVIVEENFKIYNKYIYDKATYTKKIIYKQFEILRDVPSLAFQPVQKKFLSIIKQAKREIFLETPYFLPGSNLRKALTEASSRGVKVNIIIPKKSDVHILDILSGKYMGELAKSGVKVHFFTPQNLHSKLFLCDRKYFIIGSANFDYRSFRYQHEICLFGQHKSLSRQLVNHFRSSLKDCQPFDLASWKKRPKLQKYLERMLVPIRHLL
ncbi:MAG: phospholipase D-like domain-containing protein [Bacteroidota bacterium]